MEPFSKELVLKAYQAGIFPMGSDDGLIRWYSPDPRCIIDLDNFHPPKRLLRTYRKNIFDLSFNKAFPEVLSACADRETTWITQDFIDVYTQLYQEGYAHSVEAFQNSKLVGGLYGVSIGGAFMGESMFHTATDASKVCLVHLVHRLKERGFILLDCQYMTKHLNTLGAVLIPRQTYLVQLQKALTIKARFDD